MGIKIRCELCGKYILKDILKDILQQNKNCVKLCPTCRKNIIKCVAEEIDKSILYGEYKKQIMVKI